MLEVAVDSGPQRNEDAIRFRDDRDRSDVRGSITGRGSLPTRRWVFGRLERLFQHVYMTVTQPAFDRFRLDWREPAAGRQQDRVIFVATRQPLENDQLTGRIPELQIRA